MPLTDDVREPVEPLCEDGVSLRRWFLMYALGIVASVVAVVLLAQSEPWTWSQWQTDFGETFRQTGPAIKLIVFAVYLSVCCLFCPLPSAWIVAAVATAQAAVAPGIWSTTLLVASVGALASTVANLNEYHLLTWMLRNHRVAKLKNLKMYKKAEAWFAKSPFTLLAIFNILPLPIDVARMLAASYRYPRHHYAAANFVGRFIRYGVIAYVTYWMSRESAQAGWIAISALLGVSVVLGVAAVIRKLLARRANRQVQRVSEPA